MSGEYHKTEAHPASLENETKTVIEESRMVLPGIQAVFGFQLMAVFNNGFEQLTSPEKILHLCALVLVAIAVALIMTPASYHRIAEKGIVSRRFVEIGSRLLAFAMFPLMLGLSVEVFIVARLIIKDIGICTALTVLLIIFFLSFWYLFPWTERRLGLAASIHRSETNSEGSKWPRGLNKLSTEFTGACLFNLERDEQMKAAGPRRSLVTSRHGK